MRHVRRLLLPFGHGAFAVAWLVCPLALAANVAPMDATPEQRKEAMGHFTLGRHALEAKDFVQAITELRASLEVVDSPNARLELSRALRDSGKLEDAWEEYGRVIERATGLAAREERYSKTADAATAEREALKEKLAFVTVTVPHPPAAASLTVGGRAVASESYGAPIPVGPGSIDVVLTDDGKDVASKTIQVAAGDRTAVTLEPNQDREGPSAETSDDDKPEHGAAQPTPDASSSADDAKLRPFAYVAGGLGVVGLGTFTVLGLMSNATYSDLQTACHPGCPPDKRGEIDSGRTEQTVANVGLAVGLVGLAAGATLWFVGEPAKSAGKGAALVVTPGYLGLRGSL